MINYKPFRINYICQKNLLINITTRSELVQLLKKQILSPTVNPYIVLYLYIGSFYYLYISKKFFTAFTQASSIYLDGFYLGWLIRILYNKKIERFGNEDYLFELISYCVEHNKKVFLLGSTESSLKKAVEVLKIKFPKIAIDCEQGFLNDNQKVITKIEKYSPDLLVIGMGLGRQEEWIFENRENLKKISVVVTLGNFIDILSGERKLPPEILKKYHMRWMYRLVIEPRRLWKRYILGFTFVNIQFSYCFLINLKKWLLNKIKKTLLIISTR